MELLRRVRQRPRLIIALVIVAIVAGAIIGAARPKGFLGGSGYRLIGFDAERVYADEAALTSIGPRMSGTEAEYQGAAYIAGEFEKAGLQQVEVSAFSVRMYEVKSARVSMVKYGPLGQLPAVVGPDRMHTYEHTVDYVVQGYSGSRRWANFGDDLQIYDIGNGSDDTQWANAQGMAGIVSQEPGVAGNTILFFKAEEFGLSALILHNERYGEDNDYIPISKSTGLPDGKTSYPDIPFFMVSKSVGDEMKQLMPAGWRVRIDMDVVREDRPVKVVTGDVTGSDDPRKFVLLGAHHDTVYNGDGAVDDTSGTATIIELARQLAKEKPAYTIRLATFGGEEEGIFGSYAWHDAHKDEIAANLIHYFNFDMDNVDIERCNEMWVGTNTNASVRAMKEIVTMAQAKYPYFEKYNITVMWEADLPNNSDHASFEDAGKKVAFAYGCGSLEYHTYKDDISRINAESLGVAGIIQGSYALALANGANGA